MESLLEHAGFTVEEIPKEWDAFWAFCDRRSEDPGPALAYEFLHGRSQVAAA
jgi:hypothetical protein